MRYDDPPGVPDALAVVVASIEEVMAERPVLRSFLARFGVPERDRDDLMQEAVIVTWRALTEGRVRGPRSRAPGKTLRGFMLEATWYLAMNYRTKWSNRRELLAESGAPLDALGPDPIARLEARDMLGKLARRPRSAAFLMSAATETPLPERLAATPMPASTYHLRLARARRWAATVYRSGVWQEPPQPMPPVSYKKRHTRR